MNPTQAAETPRAIVPASRSFWQLPGRHTVMAISTLAGVAFIALATMVLNGRAAVLLLDYGSKHFPYPFTIQNVMHIVFFIGLGELFVRWRTGIHETGIPSRADSPRRRRDRAPLADLGPIRRRVSVEFDGENGFLPSLVNLGILQFQASRSVDQAATVMNSSLELIAHRVDLRYGVVRFIAWLVPTLGFIGTVYALGASLSEAGAAAELNVKEVAKTLGVGFDCTMVALAQSAILVFLMQLVQEKEEIAVNLAGDYCAPQSDQPIYWDG